MYIGVSLKQFVFHIILVFTFFEKISCQDERYYFKIVMVVDYPTYYYYSQNVTRCQQIAREIVNVASYHLKTLNVYISLVETIVWTEPHENLFNYDGLITLNNIISYKNNNEPFTSIYANNTLVFLTNSSFLHNTVGYAYNNAACSRGYSVILLALELPTENIGLNLAHESGHLLSMEHDDASITNHYCPCPYSKCVMISRYYYNATHVIGWTNCSFAYFNNFKKSPISHCLTIPPSENGPSYCGDGIVQSNEACDCGPSSTGCGSCCNPQTCTLTSNAVCGSGPCCNLTTCNYIEASSATICRQSVNSNCDFIEYCDGQSQFCPQDRTVHDGVRCSYDAFCYKGKCGSPDDYCSYLNHRYAKRAKLLCFDDNFHSTDIHPCGRNETNSGILCDYEDIECGRLACDPIVTNFVVPYDGEGLQKEEYYYNTSREVIRCVIIKFVDTLPKDAGYTPNGAICGFDYLGICIDTKCIPVQQILNVNACPGNCNGRGLCNNLGQCHCDPGYNLPDCSNSIT